MGWGLLRNWEFEKPIGRDSFINRRNIYEYSLGAPIKFPRLSTYLYIKAKQGLFIYMEIYHHIKSYHYYEC